MSRFSDDEYFDEIMSIIKKGRRDNAARKILHEEASESDFDNETMDTIVDDAISLYNVYSKSGELKHLSYDELFELACDTAAEYHAAVIADSDDEIYNSFNASQRSRIDQMLKMRKYLVSDDDRNTRSNDRRRGRSRGSDDRSGPGYGSRRERNGGGARSGPGYGSRRSRPSADQRTENHAGSNVGRGSSIKHHIANMANNIAAGQIRSAEVNSSESRRERIEREERERKEQMEMQKSAEQPRSSRQNRQQPQPVKQETYMLPASIQNGSPYGIDGPMFWPTVYHDDIQVPVYQAETADNTYTITGDAVLEKDNPLVEQMKQSNHPNHSSFLLFPRRGSDADNGNLDAMTGVEDRFGNAAARFEQINDFLDQVGDTLVAKPDAQFPNIFLRKRIVIEDPIGIIGDGDPVFLVEDYVYRHIKPLDPSQQVDQLLIIAQTVHISDYEVTVYGDDHATVQRALENIPKCQNYLALQEIMRDLETALPRRYWAILNGALTEHVLEILRVEFAMPAPEMLSFTRQIDVMVDMIEKQYGADVANAFSDTVTRVALANLNLQLTEDSSETGGYSYQRQVHQTVVMLPLASNDIDYAINDNTGVGMVSKELMPNLHRGLRDLIGYASNNNCRRITMVTTDVAKVGVHLSMINGGEGVVLLSMNK